MRRFFTVLGGVTLLAHGYILFGLDYRGTGMSSILQLLVAMYIGGASALVAIIAGVLYGLNRHPPHLRTAARAAGIAAACVSLLLTIPIGQRLLARDVGRAKGYCQSLLDEGHLSRGKDGLYPKSQKRVTAIAEPPRLLKRQSFYTALDGGQEFALVIRFGFHLRWIYSSRHPGWELRS